MKNQKTRIAITGAMGRMGQMLIKDIQKNKNACLIAAIVPSNNQYLNQDIGENIGIGKINILIKDYLDTDQFDVLIDFTNPKSSLKYLEICLQLKKNIVIGTTGFTIDEIEYIKKCSHKISIILSANFSIGINIMFQLIKKATQVLGNTSDIEILEAHHRNKIDAPSGTALKMGEIIAQIMNWDLKKSAIYSRQKLNNIREKNKIGFSTIRAGDIVGKHSVLFTTSNEQINITHTAFNRNTFSQGAIQSAIWIHQKKIGLFDMNDVLSF